MQAESRKVQGTGASDESLLPEPLHALSQPLTAFRCSLELTLLQPRNSEEYRKRLHESLDLTEEITTLAAGQGPQDSVSLAGTIQALLAMPT
jgi:hypothetical protein